ncbi:unnamed protein product [Clonostachys rosea]|uniref:SMP domain-containing protein n=1 Tax=Bionectria ochroleuca TaxID=29856 RepID=A0ABY6UI23_BIOOC|nr:unnamed protein product [Clonostachys rosea]
MLFSAFLAASAATLVVASFKESDDIALRSFTDIDERDELLGVQARSTIARETITAIVDMEVATPMDQEEARNTTMPRETKSTRGTRIAGEAIPVPKDMEVATPGMAQISGEGIMAREAIPVLRDTEVATPGMAQISGGAIVAREAMSFRDRKA